MNENEVKELINEEVDRIVNQKLASVSANIEEQAGECGFKAGLLGFFICSVLTGVILVIVEIFALHRPLLNLDGGSVSSLEMTAEDSDSISDLKREIEGFYEVVSTDYEVNFYEDNDSFSVSLMRHFNSGYDQVYMSSSEDNVYAYAVCRSVSYDDEMTRIKNNEMHSHEEEKISSSIYYVIIQGHQFPVSPNQLEALQKFLEMVPTSA